MKPYIFLLLIFYFKPINVISQDNYYISQATGDDTNPGTALAPFKTINFAANLSQPGDTIHVLPGDYSYDGASNPWDNILIPNSGNANGYITFIGISDENGKKPTIISASNAGFTCNGKSYIIIDNFEITTVEEDINDVSTKINPEQWRERVGINILDGSHHIIVRNCYIHDMRGNGIQCYKGDVLLIENNLFEHNGFHSNNGNSGFSMYQMKDIEVPNFPEYENHRLIIKNNISRYNVNLRGFKGYENKMTDGNGIIIDDFRHEQGDKIPYTSRTLLLGNICYGNGGQGINIFSSDKVDVYHNTLFDNAHTTRIINPAYDVAIADTQLQIGDATDIVVKNNILVNSGGGNTVNTFNNGTIDYAANIHWNSTGSISSMITSTDQKIDPKLLISSGISNAHTTLLATMTNPFDENALSSMLREPTQTENFEIQNVNLQADSPAIDAAEDVGLRTGTGLKADIGALEFNVNELSIQNSSFQKNKLIIYTEDKTADLVFDYKQLSISSNFKLKIYDLSGKLAYVKKVKFSTNKVLHIPRLANGSYIIHVSYEHYKWVKKFKIP